MLLKVETLRNQVDGGPGSLDLRGTLVTLWLPFPLKAGIEISSSVWPTSSYPAFVGMIPSTQISPPSRPPLTQVWSRWVWDHTCSQTVHPSGI